MTPADAARLLAVAALYDKRTIGETDARTWAAELAGIGLDEAITAAREHYRTAPTVWLCPGHVLAVVRRHRRARLERGWRIEAAAVGRLDPDDVGSYLARLRDVRAGIGGAGGVQPVPLPPSRFDASDAQRRRNAQGRARCEQVLAGRDDASSAAERHTVTRVDAAEGAEWRQAADHRRCEHEWQSTEVTA